VFGAFLILTGVKMWWAAGKEPDLDDNPALKLLRKLLPVSKNYDGENFWTVENGKKIATPLFMVICLVALTDVIFAVDSIPAIFAITSDPFIVLTSNVFAILGLRAMYFLLAAVASKFHLLNYGLAVILVFIGTKMMLIDIFKIPVAVSLGVVWSWRSWLCSYCAVHPPSMGMAAPVRLCAAGSHSQTTVRAISEGSEVRPLGCFSRNRSRMPASRSPPKALARATICGSMMAVSVQPGQMQLAVTPPVPRLPAAAASSAVTRVRPTRPNLAAT
jgi:hypothetical protein